MVYHANTTHCDENELVISERFNFRRAIVPEDLVSLRVLQSTLFPVQYSDTFYDNLLREDYETILAFSTDDDVEALCGVATARVSEMSHEPHSSCCSPVEIEGYIMTLGVAPSRRGMGLGSHLLKMIKEVMIHEVQCDILTLHVKAGNEPAFRLYQNHDFVIAENLPKHYIIDNKLYDAARLLYRHRDNQSCLDHILVPMIGLCLPVANLVNRVSSRVTDRIFGRAVLPL